MPFLEPGYIASHFQSPPEYSHPSLQQGVPQAPHNVTFMTTQPVMGYPIDDAQQLSGSSMPETSPNPLHSATVHPHPLPPALDFMHAERSDHAPAGPPQHEASQRALNDAKQRTQDQECSQHRQQQEFQ
eukprot:CAMPEP_0196664214 /NCGR_PEP_ID=MMETSP1086-20130531/56183_1 /TAXON_ID=77921 /ORGANISM="Cyanoptyche  gloeocystis , Strain SAG4.97" /LENGTH=128 /DNA_ID=CAMNT_0042000415 /DNA_START=376 /DNA_END=762 /DNA_ORIENTATION=-